jgi:Cu/Ag efflux pump CusA
MSLSTAGWPFARFALRLGQVQFWHSAVERVRPKMMAVVAIMAGLLPIIWGSGTGSEVMQRIAVPMIGGMISSTVLTLVVIPAVDASIKGCGLSPQSLPLLVKSQTM